MSWPVIPSGPRGFDWLIKPSLVPLDKRVSVCAHFVFCCTVCLVVCPFCGARGARRRAEKVKDETVH